MQESIYRAAIADIAPLSRIGTVYGVFNTALGLGTLASGVIFGFFIDQGYSAIVVMEFVMVLRVGAIIVLSARATKPTWKSPTPFFCVCLNY
jgi:MFS family permease